MTNVSDNRSLSTVPAQCFIKYKDGTLQELVINNH